MNVFQMHYLRLMELKKKRSNEYLHSVHKGGLDYVKFVLNRNKSNDVINK